MTTFTMGPTWYSGTTNTAITTTIWPYSLGPLVGAPLDAPPKEDPLAWLDERVGEITRAAWA